MLMKCITKLVLCLPILIFSSCSYLGAIFGLERLDYDLIMDFCIENKTDCQVEVFIQHYYGKGSLRPITYSSLVGKGEFYTFCGGQEVLYQIVGTDEDVFQRIAVGDVREDTYVQVKNLDDGAVVQWFAKDTPKAYFYDFANWKKEDAEKYRKYTLTLTSEIFDVKTLE